MTLKEWMQQNGYTSARLAKRLGVSRQQVDRYRDGVHIPGRAVMPKVIKATAGDVGPADFYATVKRAG